MFTGDPPTTGTPQPSYNDAFIREKVKENIQRVIYRRYILLQDIEEFESLMFFFHVPKGEKDIKMVYDRSNSGLNSSLYAPWFALPTIDTFAWWVILGTWCADNDYGDMFFNFLLFLDLQKFCSIDLIELFLELVPNTAQMVVVTWVQNAMGFSPSSYCYIQGGHLAKRIIIGNPNVEKTLFIGSASLKTYNFLQPTNHFFQS